MERRSLILEIASTLMAKKGTKFSLREIERLSNVSSASFRRLFATKEALVAHVLEEAVQGVIHDYRRTENDLLSRDIFVRWAVLLVNWIATYDGLASMMARAVHDPSSGLHETAMLLVEETRMAMQYAQESSMMGAEVKPSHIVLMLFAIAWMAEHDSSHVPARSPPHAPALMFHVLLEGFEAGARKAGGHNPHTIKVAGTYLMGP